MERRRVSLALLIVSSLGVILSTIGTFVASGIDPVGPLYSTFTLTFTIFSLLFIVSLALSPDIFKTKQNQSQAELDSSLV
jgi:hypothetical protein